MDKASDAPARLREREMIRDKYAGRAKPGQPYEDWLEEELINLQLSIKRFLLRDQRTLTGD